MQYKMLYWFLQILIFISFKLKIYKFKYIYIKKYILYFIEIHIFRRKTIIIYSIFLFNKY